MLVSVLIVSGCSKSDQLFVVRAVAAGVSSVSPFFEEDGQLGTDIHLREARPSGGVQASNNPGLYGGATGGDDSGSPGQDGDDGATGEFGGSTKPGTCDVEKLKNFLTAPENSAKAQEWARVLRITTDEIPGYIDRLTPVVLRHDTLVTNHDYEDGKAVPYAALLQAGIAVLVDQQGLPAVKCSCGNPLLPFEGDAAKTKVQFKDGNKKWADFRQDHVVVVKPPPGQQDIRRLQLVDVHNPDRGIARPLGTEGKNDTSFSTHEKHTVPAVTGMVFAQATQSLADEGLAMAYDGGALPPDDAPVIASQPAEGSKVEWGTPVTLSVRDDSPSDSGDGGDSPSESGGATTDGPDDSSSGPDASSSSPGTSPPTPSGDSSGPSSSGGGTGTPTTPGSSGGTDGGTDGPTNGGTGSSPPPDTSPPDTPPPDTSPPEPSQTPTRSDPVTPSQPTSAAPPSVDPTVSSAPPSTEPESSAPAPVDPGTSDSAPGEPSTTDSGGTTQVMT
ncbi:DUF6777 domain-containing protein [Streptomyces sp. SD15]